MSSIVSSIDSSGKRLRYSALFVIPGVIAAIVYSLYGPVVIMEQHGVRGRLRRSRTFSRGALGTVLIITLIQFALPILIGKAAVSTDIKAGGESLRDASDQFEALDIPRSKWQA